MMASMVASMGHALAAVALATLAACSGSGSGGGGAPKPPPNAADRDTCASDDDCTLVEACCGCTAGGRRVAIRKDAVAEYDATREARCADTVCAAMMSEHSSCHAEATCASGRCKVMAHMRSESESEPAAPAE